MMPVEQNGLDLVRIAHQPSLGLRFQVYDGRGGKCGCAAFSSSTYLNTSYGHRARSLRLSKGRG
jgi:hypothetical protein